MEQVALAVAPRGRLVRAWELRGGVSARVTCLEIDLGGGVTRRYVVRRHGPRDLAADQHIAAHESRLLNLLEHAGIPAPHPVHVDETCSLLPSPYIVVSFIEGATEIAPDRVDCCLGQMAALLSRIHRVNPSEMGFLRSVRPPEGCSDPNPPVLLHGDFWPGNILWRNGLLNGVIDWEDAAIGDPLADVANARLEVRWAFGIKAMNDFTEWYRASSEASFVDLPRWDITAADRKRVLMPSFGLDRDRVSKMRDELELFSAEASAQLGRKQDERRTAR